MLAVREGRFADAEHARRGLLRARPRRRRRRCARLVRRPVDLDPLVAGSGRRTAPARAGDRRLHDRRRAGGRVRRRCRRAGGGGGRQADGGGGAGVPPRRRAWHRVPSSSSWSATMLGVCEAAHLLGDLDAAAEAYVLLEPYAHLPVMASLGVASFGSAHRPLALAARTMGDLDLAVAHLERAVVAEMAIGDRPWHAMALAALADVLDERARGGDRQRAVELRGRGVAAARRARHGRAGAAVAPAQCQRGGVPPRGCLLERQPRRSLGHRAALRRPALPRPLARQPGRRDRRPRPRQRAPLTGRPAPARRFSTAERPKSTAAASRSCTPRSTTPTSPPTWNASRGTYRARSAHRPARPLHGAARRTAVHR